MRLFRYRLGFTLHPKRRLANKSFKKIFSRYSIVLFIVLCLLFNIPVVSAATAPVVSTDDPSGVGVSNVTLHGTLTDDGGEDCLTWFEWGTTTSYGNTSIETVELYQENFNSFTAGDGSHATINLNYAGGYSSGGSWYGGFNAAKIVDKNWGTYGTIQWGEGDTAWIEMTYYKPSNCVINHVKWRVKDDYQTETITIPDSVVDYYDDKIEFRIYLYTSGPFMSSKRYGYDGSWNEVDGGWVATYEEAIIWDVSARNISTGESFDRELTGLTPGTTYHYRAVTNNSNSTVNGSDKSFTTAMNITISDTTLVEETTATVNGDAVSVAPNSECGFWVNNNSTVDSSNFVQNLTCSGTYSSGDSITKDVTGLDSGQIYYVRSWVNSTDSFNYSTDTNGFLTKPLAPADLTVDNLSSTYINLSWTKGTGANNTVLVRKTDSYPSSRADGTVVYNGSEIYYNNTITTFDNYYYRAWSYTNWTGLHQYSDAYTSSSISAVVINVYNESGYSLLNNWSLFVTDESGDNIFTQQDCSSPFAVINSSMPFGDDTMIQITKTGFKTKSFYQDLVLGGVVYLNFYLPPDNDEELQVIISTVDDYTSDETILLDCEVSTVAYVELYNLSYMGWEYVADDKYSISGKTVTVDSTALSINITKIRVSYYCVAVEHYILRVLNELGQPVSDAEITVSKYVSATDAFEVMYSIRSDSNGEQFVDLYAGTLYKVHIVHDDYQNSTNDWIPPTIQYDIDVIKTFYLKYKTIIPHTPDNPSEHITFYAEKDGDSIWVYFDDDTHQTISYQIFVFEQNLTTGTISLFGTDSGTTYSVAKHFLNIDEHCTYSIWLHYNHTYFSYQRLGPHIIRGNLVSIPGTNATEINTMFDQLYGSNPFGWHNFIMSIFLILGFFYADQRDAGKILVMIGGILIFINVVVGFNSVVSIVAGGAVPVLFIIFGVIVMWNDSTKHRS